MNLDDELTKMGKEEKQENAKQTVDPITKQAARVVAREFSKQAIRGMSIATGDPKKVMPYASAGVRIGAKLGSSLEGVYSRRNTRKGQIQEASRNVSEAIRNRENPEIYKGEQEYDE